MRAFQTAITFNGVSFSYGDRMVVENVNLAIPRGMKLGVAGEKRPGKSTLVNLLFRFYDPSGDHSNRRPRPARDLFARLAAAHGTGQPGGRALRSDGGGEYRLRQAGATAEEVEAAARAVRARIIEKLPQDLPRESASVASPCPAASGSASPSPAPLFETLPSWFLDEATAALDSQSEAEAQAAIDRLAEHRTVICGAHRLSTLASMDQVIVLSNGRLIETGRFPDLLQAGGAFATMASRQGLTDAYSSHRVV